MAASTTRLRVAKKSHQCTERSYHTIKPGDLYVHVTMSPWHEMARSKKWQTIKACLRCADEFGIHNSDTRAALEAKGGDA